MKDKVVIDSWLQLYNRVNGTDYTVVDRPDETVRDSKAIDALCEDSLGNRLALEHTLIQPFGDEKKDSDRFLKTLAALEDDKELMIPGYTIHVSQPVACIPNGVQWSRIRDSLRDELKSVLPLLKEGGSCVTIRADGHAIALRIWKRRLTQTQTESFKTGRIWPGDPSAELILAALEAKTPKLSAYQKEKKILLLERDAIAGTIESQFEQLPVIPDIQAMLDRINEVWAVNTAGFERESVIFTNVIWPNLGEHTCSLNLKTGEFWQLHKN